MDCPIRRKRKHENGKKHDKQRKAKKAQNIQAANPKEEMVKKPLLLQTSLHLRMGGGCSSSSRTTHGNTESLQHKGLETCEGRAVGPPEEGGCTIERTEERAITIHQLVNLISYINECCKTQQWVDRDGVLQQAESVNLFCVVDNFIKPATAKRRCSYVELVAEGSQPADWFVSHWWGEGVYDFAKCIQRHAADRQQNQSRYWVCAYANNQWNIQSEIGSDPSESSFRRAMRLSRGTVSVLDRDAICFTRVWCIFEVYISIMESGEHRSGEYLFDMYTVAEGHGPIGITDGYAAVDQPPKQARRKRHREFNFPFDLARRALEIKLETAQASVELDRQNILNSIVKAKDFDTEPPSEHSSYTMLNQLLHGRFAAASIVKAIELQENLTQHCAALRTSLLKRLTLHFGGCSPSKVDDDLVTLLANSLPVESLDALFLGFSSCQALTSKSVKTLAACLPNIVLLQNLDLHFAGCSKAVTDTAVEELAGGLTSRAATLNVLNLDFSGTRLTEKAIASLTESMKCMTVLEKLNLRLVNCKYVSRESQLFIKSAVCASVEINVDF